VIPQESRWEISGHLVYPRTCTCTRWNSRTYYVGASPRTYTDSHTKDILASRRGTGSSYDSCASGGHFRERERERESQVPVGDRDCPTFYHILLYMRERFPPLSLSFSLFWRLPTHSRREGGPSLRIFLGRDRFLSSRSSITETRPGPQFRPSTIASGPTGSLRSLSFALTLSLSLCLSSRCSHNGLAVDRISEGIRAARLRGAREESARFVPRGPKSIYDLRHSCLEKRRSGVSISVIARCTIAVRAFESVGFTRVYLVPCSSGASSLIVRNELSEIIPIASLKLELGHRKIKISELAALRGRSRFAA